MSEIWGPDPPETKAGVSPNLILSRFWMQTTVGIRKKLNDN